MFLTETDQSVLPASQVIPLGNVVEAISSTDAHSRVVPVQDESYAIPLLDGDGILDPQSTFSVRGQPGDRWVVSNRP